MQNCRNNMTPYTNYRQSQNSSSTVSRNTLEDKPLAMAYVPWQTWTDIYEAEKGFHCGTIFQELNLPFNGKGGRCV